MSTLNDKEISTSLFRKAFLKSISEPFPFTYCKNILFNYSYFFHVGWKWKENNKPQSGNTLN